MMLAQELFCSTVDLHCFHRFSRLVVEDATLRLLFRLRLTSAPSAFARGLRVLPKFSAIFRSGRLKPLVFRRGLKTHNLLVVGSNPTCPTLSRSPGMSEAHAERESAGEIPSVTERTPARLRPESYRAPLEPFSRHPRLASPPTTPTRT